MSVLLLEKFKFFDEVGVYIGIGNFVYGNFFRGEVVVEVIFGNKKGVNVIFSLLCGLEGVFYVNIVEGVLDFINFFNFFVEVG